MKNTNYFQHDHNSRGDEKILKMRLIHGWQGFGIFWAITEKLYESSSGELENNSKLIAYDLQVEEKLVKSIIEDFDIFDLNGNVFSHKRVKEHNDFRKHQAESGRKGGLRTIISKPQGSLEQASSHKGKEIKESKERKALSSKLDLEAPILYLNEKAKRDFDPKNKSTQDLIRARHNEGRTIDDFKTVIDRKCAQWLTSEKMLNYLRPSTLFNRTNFENYLNEKDGNGHSNIPESLRKYVTKPV